jgi:hypothetical protein
VLSPSTENTDRREKAEGYARIESLDVYVLAHPLFRRLEVATRGGAGQRQWQAVGSRDIWYSPYGDIVIDELYDAIDADATT